MPLYVNGAWGSPVNDKKFYKPYVLPLKNFLRKIRHTHEKRVADGLRNFLHRDVGELRAVAGVSAGEECRDDEIIRRVIAAYKRGSSDSSKPSAIWRDIYDTHQAPLHDILVGDDHAAIERMLRRPGDSALFFGFEGGVSAGLAHMVRHGAKSAYLDVVCLAPHDHLIKLAEITGALPFENPERTPKAYGSMPTDKILEAIERRLDIKLTFPNPYPDEAGTRTSRGIMTYRAVHAVYQAWRIKGLVKAIANPRVLEIGGGLGRTAYHAWQLGIRDYTIIDLPFTGVSQGYFLMRTLGEGNVVLNGEDSDAHRAKIKLFQPAAFLGGADRYDLIVNVDSLPEMSRATAEGYWNRIREATPTLLSINQEANPFTVREVADADAAHVKSVLRYPNGLRRGYVEEIFSF